MRTHCGQPLWFSFIQMWATGAEKPFQSFIRHLPCPVGTCFVAGTACPRCCGRSCEQSQKSCPCWAPGLGCVIVRGLLMPKEPSWHSVSYLCATECQDSGSSSSVAALTCLHVAILRACLPGASCVWFSLSYKDTVMLDEGPSQDLILT